MEKRIKQRADTKKELSEIFINGKKAMAMSDIDQFQRHTGSALHSIFVTTNRTKATVTTEGNEIQLSTIGAGIHGTTEGWSTAVNHLIDVSHFSISGMKSIFDFFIIVGKDSL